MPRYDGHLANGHKEKVQSEKRKKCLEMREAGYSYEEIAEAMGWKGRSTARKFVQRALKATYQEPADAVRQMELRRLDRLARGIWQQALGTPATEDKEAEPPSLFAMDRLMKLMDRRARLLGLDAPIKVKTDQNIQGSISGIARVIVVEDDGRATREPLANGLPTYQIPAGSSD